MRRATVDITPRERVGRVASGFAGAVAGGRLSALLGYVPQSPRGRS